MTDPKVAKVTEDVLQGLSNTEYACSSLTPLSGGLANFTFKGSLTKPLPDGTKEVAVKHGEDYLAAMPAFLLPTTRCVSPTQSRRLLQEAPRHVTNSRVESRGRMPEGSRRAPAN